MPGEMSKLEAADAVGQLRAVLDGAALAAYYGPAGEVEKRIRSLLGPASEDHTEDWRALRDTLNDHQQRVLARFGLRAPMLAIRARDPEYLRAGLLAHVLLTREVRDWRDDLVHFAPYFHVARVLQIDPSALFGDAAAAAVPELADVMRTFGRRRDVTLGAFLWRQVDTPDGPSFEMLGWQGAPSGGVVGEPSWDEVNRAQVERLRRWLSGSGEAET